WVRAKKGPEGSPALRPDASAEKRDPRTRHRLRVHHDLRFPRIGPQGARRSYRRMPVGGYEPFIQLRTIRASFPASRSVNIGRNVMPTGTRLAGPRICSSTE